MAYGNTITISDFKSFMLFSVIPVMTQGLTQWANWPKKKQSEGVLKIQCHVVKNTLLHTVFSAILPTKASPRNKAFATFN